MDYRILASCFILVLSPLAILGIDSEDPMPVAYFQAILMDSEKPESLVYAPWGNIKDDNASVIEILLSSDTLSGRFAYYGASPLRMYRKANLSESTTQSKNSRSNPLLASHLQQAMEHPFKKSAESVFINEEILLLKKIASQKFNVYSLPFSQDKVPNGSFLFQSFTKEDTFFRVGTQKIKLSGGGSRLVSPKVEEFEKSLKIEGFLLRDKKYQLAMDRNISAFKKKRGIFIINVKGNSIKPYSLIERYANYKKAMGFGVSPLKEGTPVEDSEEAKIP